jgi:hypothetical protein
VLGRNVRLLQTPISELVVDNKQGLSIEDY